MMIQYYCYTHKGINFVGWSIENVIVDIGYGPSECEWIVPGTIGWEC